MLPEPSKPAPVPGDAVYSPEHGAWELCTRDSQGRRHGECRLYRDDGSLWIRSHYVADRPAGSFTGYHPNGEILQRGQYVEGRLDGIIVKFVSEAPGSEPLRGCCVPAGATELRSRYRAGLLLRQVFHDGEGRPLAPDGTPWPERAPAIPDDAEFDASTRRWCARSESGDSLLVRYYDVDGLLAEELAFQGGVKQWRRGFDADGLREEHAFDADGLAHGAAFVRAAPSPYLDARLRLERGGFVHGQPTGVWRFSDGDDVELRAVSRGAAVPELGRALERLERELPPSLGADALFRGALELRNAGRVREALCLAARSAALSGDARRFRELLDEHVVPLRPELASERGEALTASSSVTPEAALEALLLGADAAAALRTLAAVLSSATRWARDFIEAALLLAPERVGAHLTRALIRLELGDRAGALADAARLAPEFEETARLVRDFARVQFPEFGFWPARDVPEPDPSLLPVTVEQPLEAVRRCVFTYATRLARLRDALARVSTERGFLPPDTSALLVEGPAELRRFQATILDETEDGTESSAVEIDETLDSVVDSDSVPRLVLRARADWAGLSWLCWAAGLDRVALPERLDVPAAFPAAIQRATERCFRAHDRIRTGGLVALSQGIPGFVWEGDDLDSFHPRLVEVAAAEYLEIRAVFFWLLFAENLSPFQSDLRRV